jgi:hypothetical protein
MKSNPRSRRFVGGSRVGRITCPLPHEKAF